MAYRFNPFTGKLDVVTNTLLDLANATNEPTGFHDPDSWTVEYDYNTRIVTATPAGTQAVYVQGRVFFFSAPVVSAAHDAIDGTYFFELEVSGAITISTTPFDFANKAQVAVVYYDTAETPPGWALRESHGCTMDWATHLELHETSGTYLVDGGGLTAGTYTEYSVSDGTNPALASITPGVPATTVADEDLRTALALLADGGPYIKFSYDWIGLKWSWTEDATAPFFETGNVPYYNPSSGGAALAALANDDYVCWYCFAIPASADIESQKFRYIWIPGQIAYSPATPNTAQRTVARDKALAEDPRSSLILQALPAAEFVPIAKLVVHYRTTFNNNAYRLRVEGYQKLVGSRANFGSGSSITLPVYVDSSIGITTVAAVGGLDPAVETNQKSVNERYASFGYLGPWVTSTAYRVGNIVQEAAAIYRCIVAHTSGTFATDLGAAKWEPAFSNVVGATVNIGQAGGTVNIAGAVNNINATDVYVPNDLEVDGVVYADGGIQRATAAVLSIGGGLTTGVTVESLATFNAGASIANGQFLTLTGATASRALTLDASSQLAVSATTATQLGYLSSATGTTGTATSNLVFSASPTLSGTVGGALTWSGAQTFNAGATLTTPSAATIFKIDAAASQSGYLQFLRGTAAKGYVGLASGASDDITLQSNANLTLSTDSSADTIQFKPNGVDVVTFAYDAITLSKPVTMGSTAGTNTLIGADPAGSYSITGGSLALTAGGNVYAITYCDETNTKVVQRYAKNAGTLTGGVEFLVNASTVMSFTSAGAVTLGPSTGTPNITHTFQSGTTSIATLGYDAITFSKPVYLPSTGATASGLDFYATTTFSFAWTPNGAASTASSSVTATLTRVGNVVTMYLPQAATPATPAGTTTLLTASGIPAWARPAAALVGISGVFGVMDNNVWKYTGMLYATSSGTLTMYRDLPATAYTNGANANVARCTATWMVV